ncbi:thiosulfate sulfurtransferase-like [Symsagittifera roscoffensis]|uniref:thiosulfate sulfurtransferase-like n=1 Tax=Symsagittifera roscoffensis TaxID=84072 RepID=UPI00307CC320
MSGSTLVTSQWLNDQLINDRKKKRIQILDCTHYTDGTSAKDKFEKLHVKGAYFFNVVQCVDKTSKISNMLPAVGPFNDYVRYFGIAADIHVILYDQSETGLQTTPRVWFMFKALSHRRVSILEGGLQKWVKDGFPTSDQLTESQKREYNAGQWKRRDSMVLNVNEMKEHVKKASEALKQQGVSNRGSILGANNSNSSPEISKNAINISGDTDGSNKSVYQPAFQVIDTRSPEEFMGIVESSRGFHTGHIAGSINIPTDILVDPETRSARSPGELRRRFLDYGIDVLSDSKLVLLCNTGMGSTKVALALFLAGKLRICLYDGGFEELTKTVDKKLLVVSKPMIEITENGPDDGDTMNQTETEFDDDTESNQASFAVEN